MSARLFSLLAALAMMVSCGQPFAPLEGTGGTGGALGTGGAVGSTTGTDGDGGDQTGDASLTGGNAGDPGSGGTAGGAGGSGSGPAGAGGALVDSGAAGASGSHNGTGGGAGAAGHGGAGGTADAGGDAGVDWGACDGPGQCVAINSSCCATCGAPDVSTFVGVNSKYVASYDAGKRCNVACPAIACPLIVGATGSSNIAARCVMGRCTPFDVRQVPAYSSCQTSDGCKLRAGLACCECSGSAAWVAVSTSGQTALTQAMCAPNMACADCLPVPPVGTQAVCESNVCQVGQ